MAQVEIMDDEGRKKPSWRDRVRNAVFVLGAILTLLWVALLVAAAGWAVIWMVG